MNVLTNTSCRVVKDTMKRLQASYSRACSYIHIKIPNRIERGPTDILRALKGTIKKDPGAPSYLYHDNPYLAPLTKQNLRNFALSLESGKKAAQWVCSKHPDVFQKGDADPVISEFLPPVTYTEKNRPSEEILMSTILDGQTSKALEIYAILREDLSTKARQSLLELLCFSNSTDLPDRTSQQERWFLVDPSARKSSTWRDTEEITNLFVFLTSQDPDTAAAAYNAVLCGKAKYLQVREAWSLYETCMEKDVPLNIDSYNSIIRTIPFLPELSERRHREILKVLENMRKNCIQPNVDTLNASLETTYLFTTYEKAMEFVHILLQEFRTDHVNPSLASFWHILNIACKDSRSIMSVLKDLLDKLEKKNLRFLHPDDVNFFPTAMEIAKQLCDNERGDQVHRILLKDENFKFLANAYSQNVYYREYILLKLSTMPMEEFINFYCQLTSNGYIPQVDELVAIVKRLRGEPNDTIRLHLSKIWSLVYVHALDIDKVTGVVMDLSCHCHVKPRSSFHKTLFKYAWAYWTKKQSKLTAMTKVLWNGSTLGNVALLALRADRPCEALEVLSFMASHDVIQKTTSSTAISDMLEICIEKGYGSVALLLVEYALKHNFDEAVPMAKKIYDVIPLKENEKKKLSSLVGDDVLKLQLEATIKANSINT